MADEWVVLLNLSSTLLRCERIRLSCISYKHTNNLVYTVGGLIPLFPICFRVKPHESSLCISRMCARVHDPQVPVVVSKFNKHLILRIIRLSDVVSTIHVHTIDIKFSHLSNNWLTYTYIIELMC